MEYWFVSLVDILIVYFYITGFNCPIENLIQYFCCGTDTHRYCCSPDRYTFEMRSYIDSDSVLDYPQAYSHIPTDEIGISLINHQKMISKQFEQFQRYFLPIFILTTTILFLVGIALWFWLYKHKTFYSLGQDDSIESRSSHRTHLDSISRQRESRNLALKQQSRFSNSSTEV
jgi:hypothetical protein